LSHYVSVCLCACQCACVSVCLSVYLPVCLSPAGSPVSQYVSLSVCLCVCVSVCLLSVSVCLSVCQCLSGCLSVCLSECHSESARVCAVSGDGLTVCSRVQVVAVRHWQETTAATRLRETRLKYVRHHHSCMPQRVPRRRRPVSDTVQGCVPRATDATGMAASITVRR